MSRNKSLLVVLVLAMIVDLGAQLQAQTLKVMIAGSSAQWQTQALGAFGGLRTVGGTGYCGVFIGATAPCFHWTNSNSSGASAFALYDNRPSTPNVDAGAIWIVWDTSATCSSGCNVWAFIKVDSGVGNRCYFAKPACDVYISAAGLTGATTGAISSTLWGPDTALPSTIAALFTTASSGAGATPVTVAATDIRPEDSLWSTCRVNSVYGMNAFDATDGLGYNSNYVSGTCAPFKAPAPNNAAVGSPIQSAYPGSTATANVLGFAITGKDPITGLTVPKYSSVSVGAAPIIFVYSHTATNNGSGGSPLAGLENVNDGEVQTLFSGGSCDANVFGASDFTSGTASTGGIGAYLREPLSGTMNTTEATVFRYPVGGALGISQELGVNGASVNPLSPSTLACTSTDSKGGRWRGIGTGEVVKSVLNGVSQHSIDGMAYTFFSYGNISALAGATQANYAYTQLDGVDGVFNSYCTTGPCGDPGQPASGELPAAANLPTAGCNNQFPCPEFDIWAGSGTTKNLSFPHLRDGSYSAWSLLRVVSTGTPLTNVKNLIKSSQQYVVVSTPDYVPAVKVAVTSPKKFTDPGLKFIRSHYQQVDGSGTVNIGLGPVSKITGDRGGDMGGCIQASSSTTSQMIQQLSGTPCATRANHP